MSPGPYLERWDPIVDVDEFATCTRCARLVEVDDLDDLGRCEACAPVVRAGRARCDMCFVVCDELGGLCDECRAIKGLDPQPWPFAGGYR